MRWHWYAFVCLLNTQLALAAPKTDFLYIVNGWAGVLFFVMAAYYYREHQ